MLAVISTVQATFIVVYENGYIIILDAEKVIFLLAYHHITSPFRLDNWGPAFQSHPDRQFVAYIQAGLSQGFRIERALP